MGMFSARELTLGVIVYGIASAYQSQVRMEGRGSKKYSRDLIDYRIAPAIRRIAASRVSLVSGP